MLFELFHECPGARSGLLEIFAESEDVPGGFGGLVAVEQRIAFIAFAKAARSRVEAQRQFLAVGPQLGEHERIAAHISGHIDRRIELAGAVHIDVYAFVHAHQDQRHGIFPGRKHDRIMALGLRKFFHRHGDGVLAFHEFRIVQTDRFPGAVFLAVERDQVVIKNGQA